VCKPTSSSNCNVHWTPHMPLIAIRIPHASESKARLSPYTFISTYSGREPAFVSCLRAGCGGSPGRACSAARQAEFWYFHDVSPAALSSPATGTHFFIDASGFDFDPNFILHGVNLFFEGGWLRPPTSMATNFRAPAGPRRAGTFLRRPGFEALKLWVCRNWRS